MSTIHHQFCMPLLNWFEQHGRRDLPWQQPRSAYRVWISEIMLQQTQVATVIPYFTRFMARFPDIHALASASDDAVLSYWSGLGYYSRARNLHASAKIISTQLHGVFPDTMERLKSLPGIGDSTAAAIASLAFNKPTALLDGNVKRVLSRYFLVEGAPGKADVQKKLWGLADACMHKTRCADYSQAIMDLGATCCRPKNPTCLSCPLETTCLANQAGVVNLYPNKKIKKIIPTRHQQFILLHTADDLVYLEKRPETGLWGGLWCLPTLDMGECPSLHVSNAYGLSTEAPLEVMKMKHTFSHFHLHLVALSLKTTSGGESLPGQWFHRDSLNDVGLAKPVSRVLHCFFVGRSS